MAFDLSKIPLSELHDALGGRENRAALSGDFEKFATFNPMDHRRPVKAYADTELWLRSAFSAGTGELFGSSPPEEVARFRERNPIAGLTSQFAGDLPFYTIPFLGQGKLAFGLAGKIPGIKSVLKSSESILAKGGAPFFGGALREGSRIAPFELARVAGSLVNPEEGSFGRVAERSALNFAVVGLFGGGINKLASFSGTRFPTALSLEGEANIARVIGQDWNFSDPLQIKWRKLVGFQLSQPASQVSNEVETFRRNIERLLFDEVPKNGKYVYPLPEKKRARIVQKLFEGKNRRTKSGKPFGLASRKIVLDESEDAVEGGIASAAEVVRLRKLLEQDAPVGYQAHTQYLRHLEPSAETARQATGRFQEVLKQDFVRVGPDEWVVREASEGLYIGVRRLRTPLVGAEGQVLKGKFKDDYFLFKTTNPEDWFPAASGLNEANAKLFARGAVSKSKLGTPETPTLLGVEKLFDLLNPAQAAHYSGTTRNARTTVSAETGPVGEFIDSFIPDKLAASRQEVAAFGGAVAEASKNVLAPAASEISRSPRAVGIMNIIRESFHRAMDRSVNLLHGELSPKFIQAGKSMAGAFISTAFKPIRNRRVGGAIEKIEDLITTDEALLDLNKIIIGSLNAEEAAQLGLHPAAREAAAIMDDAIAKLTAEAVAQEIRLGAPATFATSDNAYAVSRAWKGDHRLPLYDFATDDIAGGGKNIMSYGSGNNAKEAMDDANRLARAINKEEELLGHPPLLRIYSTDKGAAGTLDPRKHMVVVGNPSEKVKQVPKRPIFGGVAGEKTAVQPGPREADLSLASMIAFENPLVKRIARTRLGFFDDPPGFTQPGVTPSFFGVRGTQKTPFTLKDITNNFTSSVIETNRFLTREALSKGSLNEQFMLLINEDRVAADRVVARFNSSLGIQGPIIRAAESIIDSALSPVFGPGVAKNMVSNMNQAMFFLTLAAGDIGFVALNVMTPIQTVLPELARGLQVPPQRMMRTFSSALIQTEQGPRQVHFLDPVRIMRLAMKDFFRPDQKTAAAMNRAMSEGAISRTLVEEVRGGTAAALEKGGMVHNIMSVVETPVAASEEMSRAYAYLAGRRQAIDFMGMGEEQAHQYAKEFVYRTMFGYTAADRPKILTGALGAGWGLFKNWSMNYTSNLINYAGEATRGNWHALAWASAGTGAVGGAVAVPFWGMADSFAKFATDSSLTDMVYQLLGNKERGDGDPITADFLLYGFPSLLGFSLQGRAAAPGSAIIRDLTMWSNIAILDRAAAMGDAIGGAVSNARIGNNPFGDQRFQNDLARALAPRTIQRGMAIWGHRGLRSLRTRNQLLPEISGLDKVLFTIGMTPLEIEKGFELQNELWDDAGRLRDMIAQLGEDYADAMEFGDGRDAMRVLRQAMTAGVPIDSVQRSAVSRISKRNNPQLERLFTDGVAQGRRRARGL